VEANILIGIPVFGGMVQYLCATSLIALSRTLQREGVRNEI
jgi:hypothetical protein